MLLASISKNTDSINVKDAAYATVMTSCTFQRYPKPSHSNPSEKDQREAGASHLPKPPHRCPKRPSHVHATLLVVSEGNMVKGGPDICGDMTEKYRPRQARDRNKEKHGQPARAALSSRPRDLIVHQPM